MFIVPWCISIVYIIFLLKSTEYVLTNHRLIVMKGKFSKNLRSIDLEKITYVDVQIGIADRRLGTGCVHIGLPGPVTLQATYRGPERYSEKETLFGVKNPYEVQKLIKETIEQYKMEMKPPVAIIDTTLKREMPCPRCAAMLEIPPTSPNMGIRCPACAHVFKLNSS
ncbi:MAG: PH domain-containing protein [Thermoplasmata archaeon]